MLNYKSALTNFLIAPAAAVLLSPVYFSLKIWKASGLTLKVIRSRTGIPDASLLRLVCRPVWLFMSCIQIIYFAPTLLCFWKWVQNTGSLLSLSRLPGRVTGTSWFNQHHNFPVISGQALFSKYQKAERSEDSFTLTQGSECLLGRETCCPSEIIMTWESFFMHMP